MQDYWDGPGAAHRRVIYKGAGFCDGDIRNKPHIGIANAFSEVSPAHIHLRMLADGVKQGIWEAGGMPLEFGVPSTCGNVAIGSEELKYELAGRDAVAMAVEFVSRVHNFAGLVLLSSCDNIVPGQLMALARLNVPSVLVTGGPMLTGSYRGEEIATPDVNTGVLSGGTLADLAGMEDAACPGFGACPVMGTANTMQILSEVMGLVLPGTSTIPAVMAGRLRAARDSGRAVVHMVRSQVAPSDILTRESLLNAATVLLAMGGSTNGVLHLLSLARELDLPLGLDDFDRLSREVPLVSLVRPNGPYSVVDLHAAGGVPALLKNLEGMLHLDALGVSGKTLREALEGAPLPDGRVIRPVDDPVTPDSGLAFLKGNLAPGGAVLRTSGMAQAMRRFRGIARAFDGDSLALQAIERGDIKAGDIVVVRYEGCRGAPGMKEIMLSTDALVARGLDASVGLITDGRFSGFNHGPIVGHICPEAFDGGPLALLRDGDRISLDVDARTLDVELSQEELEARRTQWKPPAPRVSRGMLALYAATCRPSSEGGAMQTW
jgi:dihydroxy-acid dehydratase